MSGAEAFKCIIDHAASLGFSLKHSGKALRIVSKGMESSHLWQLEEDWVPRASKIEAIKEATDVLRGKETVRNSCVRAVRGDQAWTSERVQGRMNVTCRWPCRLIWQTCLCHLHFNMISNFNLIYQHCRNLCLFHVCFFFQECKIPDLNNLMFSN